MGQVSAVVGALARGNATGSPDDSQAKLKFYINSPSPSAGASSSDKSVVSETITDITPDEFWELLEEELWRRDRPPPAGLDLYNCTELPDKSLLVNVGYRRPDGSLKQMYHAWSLAPGDDEADVFNFEGDKSLATPKEKVTLRVHRCPFFIELWSVLYARREVDEKVLVPFLQKVLQRVGSAVPCHKGAALDGTLLESVISFEVDDAILGPTALWKSIQRTLRESGAQELEAGSLFEQLCPDSKFVTCKVHIFDDTQPDLGFYELRSCSYSGSTPSGRDLEHVTYLRIHRQPYRLEAWRIVAERRQAGEEQKVFAARVCDNLLEQVKKRGRAQSTSPSDPN